MKKTLTIASIFFATVLFAQQQNAAPAAPPPPPCSAPEFRQLDFWVGEWDLTWPNAQDPKKSDHGTNTITRVLGSCVILENFDGGTVNSSMASPLKGMSVSVYNAQMKKWQQTWVDDQGGYLDFIGEFAAGRMTLSRNAVRPNGTKVIARMVFLHITKDSFDWRWESSTDGGKTFKVNWPIHYQRKK